MTEGSEMTCPVCDSDIPEEKDECPVCGVNLIPFKEGFEGDIDESSMEKVIEVISEEDEDLIDELEINEDSTLDEDEIVEDDGDEELIEDIKDLGLSDDEISTEVEEEEKITFECPVCESEVAEDASECSNCGAIFEDGDEDEEEIEEKEEDLQDISDINSEFDEWDEEIDEDVSIEDIDESLEGFDEEEEPLDIESRIEGLNENIKELVDSRIDTEELENDIKELEKVGEGESEEKLVDKIEKRIECAEEISDRLEKCDNYIEWLRGKTDVSKLESWIDDIQRGCEIGEYRIARKKARETEEDIKEIARTQGLKEGKRLEEEIEKIRKGVENKASKIEKLDLDLDMEVIDESLEKASKEKENGAFESAFHEMMKAKKCADGFLKFGKVAEEAKTKLKRIEEKEDLYQELSEKIEEGKKEAKKCSFEKATEISKETIEEIEKRSEKEEEKIDEKKKDLFKKIQEKIPEMRALLDTAREFGVDVKGGKDLINEAVKNTKQNEYEEAIEALDDCRVFFQRKLDNRIDEEIEKIKKASPEEESSVIEEIEKYREKGEYEKVSELIDKGKEKLSEKKEHEKAVGKDISEVKKMIEKGKDIGLEFPNALRLLEQAKSKSDEGEILKAEEMVDQAQEKAFQRLEDVLKEEIKEARDKLKQAKIQGANISKSVELLKETNRAQKSGDLKESLDNFKKFKDEMERIRKQL